MNELIQELAYQAEELADAEVDQGSEFHPAFCRIFAELIIRECAQLADDTPSDYLRQPYKYPSTYIKEYFGVK